MLRVLWLKKGGSSNFNDLERKKKSTKQKNEQPLTIEEEIKYVDTFVCVE